jgi:RHS repeat-associated protein
MFTPGYLIFYESWQTVFLFLAVFVMSKIEKRAFSDYGLPKRGAFGRKFWLGSASLITDASGNSVETYYYYPYGALVSSTGSDPNHYKFTGKERDSESNLDNFGARYFTSTMGRFMTPDWAARPTTVPYAVFGDPQSLNLYGYVRNDPVTQADADGHDPVPMGPLTDNSGTTWEQEMAQTLTGKEEKAEQHQLGQNNEINTKPPQPLPPPMAELKTDINGHTTTLLTTDKKDKLTVTTIETSNTVDHRALPGAGDPYTTHNVVGVVNQGNDARFGPNGAFIDTGDSPRNRDIHGGGSSLKQHAFDSQQPLTPTFGCTRGHNEDVINLGNALTNFQRANPDVLIPYVRE